VRGKRGDTVTTRTVYASPSSSLPDVSNSCLADAPALCGLALPHSFSERGADFCDLAFSDFCPWMSAPGVDASPNPVRTILFASSSNNVQMVHASQCAPVTEVASLGPREGRSVDPFPDYPVCGLSPACSSIPDSRVPGWVTGKRPRDTLLGLQSLRVTVEPELNRRLIRPASMASTGTARRTEPTRVWFHEATIPQSCGRR